MMEKIITWMPQLLLGARTTIIITIIAVAVGLVLSFFLALGKMSKNPLLNKPCSAYIFFFRGTPLLIQIYFIYFGLPQFNPALTIKSAFVAALIAYTLNSAAYLAENIRAGIQSVDIGQMEAGRSLGLPYWKTMRKIILPQAIRTMIPSIINQFIITVKDTSILSVIGFPELVLAAKNVQAGTFKSFETWTIVGIMYLIVITILSYLAKMVERRVNRGVKR